jgi:hypothetical protein
MRIGFIGSLIIAGIALTLLFSMFGGMLFSLWIALLSVSLVAFIVFLCFFLLCKKRIKKIESIKQPLLEENLNELKNICKINVVSKLYKAINDLYPHLKLFLSSSRAFEISSFEKEIFKEKERHVVGSFSGTINDNPFIIYTHSFQSVYLKTFSATESFSYTKHYTTTDSNGKKVNKTKTKQEKLTATTSKTYCDYPIYTNCFVDTGEIQKQLEFKSPDKKGMKKLKPMENKSFDKLFPASRNDEVGYRMVFTPLAQENMVKLLNSNKIRNLKYSKIANIHSIKSNTDQVVIKFLYLYDEIYRDFDYENIKRNYIDLFLNAISGVYFALAPFLTIPLFCHFNDQIDKKASKDDNIPSYAEVGSILHKMNSSFTKPDGSDANATQTYFVTKNKDNEYEFTSFSHRTVEGVEPVTVVGPHTGAHVIMVPYEERIPTVKDNNIIYVYRLEEKDKKLIEEAEIFAKYDKTQDQLGKYKDLIFYCGVKNATYE